jgi:branched-chain amino acid transport system permease protein
MFGALLIYITWMISDPMAQTLFNAVSELVDRPRLGRHSRDPVRASQMRVLVLGVVITLALRFAPRGLIPEVVKRSKPESRSIWTLTA